MLISVVSLLEDCMTHSLLFWFFFSSALFAASPVYLSGIYVYVINHKAHKESKSSFVSINCGIEVLTLYLPIVIK